MIGAQPVDPDELKQAQQRLEEMPVDKIPEPASLPPGSRMPFSPNPLFVGREDDLRALAKMLRGSGTVAIGQIAAATGLGGIGKTQLASEFVHRYGQYFAGGVFWLSFAQAEGLPAEIAQCAGVLELRLDYASLSLEEQIRLVASAWYSPLPRLLVFDNCEEEQLLAQWRPRTGGCRVLVTSRRARWDPSLGVQIRPLGQLPRLKSIELLRKFRPDLPEDEAALNAVAAELGDLPLALHLAGSFLARYKHAVTPGVYLAQLQDKKLLNHPSLQGHNLNFSPTAHDLDVGRTFALSYDQLNPADLPDSLARALLARAAYFASGEPIPRALLLATLQLAGDETETTLQAEDGLGRLVALGLLDEEAEGALVMHRLVAAFGQSVAEAGVQAAVEETLLAEANRISRAGYPRRLLAWQPHLRAVTHIAGGRADERVASLGNELGYHLQALGDLVGAQPYLERALVIDEKVLGMEHPNTQIVRRNLASLDQDAHK